MISLFNHNGETLEHGEPHPRNHHPQFASLKKILSHIVNRATIQPFWNTVPGDVWYFGTKNDMEQLPGKYNMVQTAERLGLSVQTVYYKIMLGVLIPEKHFGRNYFTVEQIEQYINKHQKENEDGNDKTEKETTGIKTVII